MTTFLYRHFDRTGALLYVGITDNVGRRTKGHKQKSPWAGAIARTTSKPYPSRIKAAIAELQAIDKEKPLHNVVPGAERRRKLIDAVMFSARIPEDLLKRMLTVCARDKIGKSDFVRKALERALDLAA